MHQGPEVTSVVLCSITVMAASLSAHLPRLSLVPVSLKPAAVGQSLHQRASLVGQHCEERQHQQDEQHLAGPHCWVDVSIAHLQGASAAGGQTSSDEVMMMFIRAAMPCWAMTSLPLTLGIRRADQQPASCSKPHLLIWGT